jgi:hypothetical protein
MAWTQSTSLMDGTVTDPQGSAVVGAEVVVVHADNAATFKTTADERGHWALPSVPAGPYRVTVTLKGFRTVIIDNIKVDAGVPSTVNAKLEIGQVSETISVSAGAEMVQTSTATVSSTIQQSQLLDLPFTSRCGMDLL